MLLSWIIKTIPRSPRAFLALLVVVGSISLAFSGLTELFVPNGADTAKVAMMCIAGLAIGLPATALFYFFQHADERQRHDASELDILSKYHEAEQRDRIYKDSHATVIFRGQDIEPKAD